MSTDLTEVRRVMLPKTLANETHSHLRKVGRRGFEGMALWAGVIDGNACRIEEVVIPQQEGLRTEHGLAVAVPGEELHRINVDLYRKKCG